MKKETEDQKLSSQEFNSTPIDTWLISDSDGTIVPFNEVSSTKIPPKEFVEKMRKYSLENPNAAISILSGRGDDYLNKHYSAAFMPDEEGRVPKIMLQGEYGATLRSSADPETMHEVVDPLPQSVKQKISDITKTAAGSNYRESKNDKKSNEINIWVERKATSQTIFYNAPSNNAQKEQLEDIKDNLRVEISRIAEEHKDDGVVIDLDSADAFVVTSLTKGMAVEQLVSGQLDQYMEGFNTSEQKKLLVFSGDDTGDISAHLKVKSLREEGVVESALSWRPNNYAPKYSTDIEKTRLKGTLNSPMDPASNDAFYILGDKDQSAQDIHVKSFLDAEKIKEFVALVKDFSEKGLLPSQSGDAQTPPIVLLTTGDILIQEPEKYPSEALDQLKDWDQGKVVLMANGAGPDSLKVKQLGLGENENLIAVSPEGQVFSSGQNLDFQDVLGAAKAANEIVSANPERSAEIQLLRAVQEVLVTNGLIQKKEQGQETVAAPALGNQDTKPAAVERAAPVQQAASVPAAAAVPGNLSALGTSTRAASARTAAASSISKRTRSADSQSPRKKSKQNKR